MTELQVIARLKIHDGKLDEFKTIAQTCLDSVRQKDPGTVHYDWYFNAASTECVVHERYSDSEALLAHVTNLGESLGALTGVADMSLEVFGAPSEELQKATEGMGIVVYSYYQGHRA